MSADATPVRPAATDEIIQRCSRGDQTASNTIVRQHHHTQDRTLGIFLALFDSRGTFDQRADSRRSFRTPEL
jgi:hypothetical protein